MRILWASSLARSFVTGQMTLNTPSKSNCCSFSTICIMKSSEMARYSDRSTYVKIKFEFYGFVSFVRAMRECDGEFFFLKIRSDVGIA